MNYTVSDWVFKKVPRVKFGIIVAKGLINHETSTAVHKFLEASEAQVRLEIPAEEIKTHSDLSVYREALNAIGINPNKYTHSVEAMCKRVVKGSSLPRINDLVDLCNAIALKYRVSMGGHDLADIDEDLSVRLSTLEDVFLPLGESAYESMPEGELVFTSGTKVQTRQWLWRQSELGKVTSNSRNIFFQLVGFHQDESSNLEHAISELEKWLKDHYKVSYQTYIVDAENTQITF